MNTVPIAIAAAALSLAAVAAFAQEARMPGVHVPGLTFTFGSPTAARVAEGPRSARHDPAWRRVASAGDGPLDLAADLASVPFAVVASASGSTLTRSATSRGPAAPR